jgi:hypothetical protein
VSGAQGVAGSSEKSSSKTVGSTTASGSLPGSQQPYNQLGWNADISSSTKEKQEQVLLMYKYKESVPEVQTKTSRSRYSMYANTKQVYLTCSSVLSKVSYPG